MAEKKFNVGIKAIIVKEDKVLIMKNHADFWEVPGGRIDSNETIDQTLERELHEEIPSIKSHKIIKILSASRLMKDIFDDVSLMLIFFLVEAEFSGGVELSDEHTEYKWATKDEALKLVYDNAKEAIYKAL